MTHLTRGDADLHYPDGSHRGTPPSTDGRELERYESRIRAHLARHAEREYIEANAWVPLRNPDQRGRLVYARWFRGMERFDRGPNAGEWKGAPYADLSFRPGGTAFDVLSMTSDRGPSRGGYRPPFGFDALQAKLNAWGEEVTHEQLANYAAEIGESK